MTTTIEKAANNAELIRMCGDFLNFGLPEKMWPGIKAYLLHGITPGAFLCSLLRNDLRYTFAHADDENIRLVRQYVQFFWNCVPASAWGSETAFDAWREKGGFEGGAGR